MKKFLFTLCFVLIGLSAYGQKEEFVGSHVIYTFTNCQKHFFSGYVVDFDMKTMTAEVRTSGDDPLYAYFKGDDYIRLYYICCLPLRITTKTFFLSDFFSTHDSYPDAKEYNYNIIPDIFDSWMKIAPRHCKDDYAKDYPLICCLHRDFRPVYFIDPQTNYHIVDMYVPLDAYEACLAQRRKAMFDRIGKMTAGDMALQYFLGAQKNRGQNNRSGTTYHSHGMTFKNSADKGDYDNANGYK